MLKNVDCDCSVRSAHRDIDFEQFQTHHSLKILFSQGCGNV